MIIVMIKPEGFPLVRSDLVMIYVGVSVTSPFRGGHFPALFVSPPKWPTIFFIPSSIPHFAQLNRCHKTPPGSQCFIEYKRSFHCRNL